MGRPISTWQEAEEAAASWMRNMGFSAVKLTGGGADGGVDVRASGAIAQVKFQVGPVGRPALQRLVGAKGNGAAVDLLFFSTSGFSAPAIGYAKEMGIGLFLIAADGSIEPANSQARRMGDVAKRKSAGWMTIGGAGLTLKGVELLLPLEQVGDVIGGIVLAALGVVAIRHGWRSWSKPAAAGPYN